MPRTRRRRGDHEAVAIRAAAAWQLRSLAKPALNGDDSGSLEAELNRLSPLHPPRRWMEWRCLRAFPWEAETFPPFLRAIAARTIGSIAVLPATGERPFDFDEASVEDMEDYDVLISGIPAAAATDLLLAALPYVPKSGALRERLIEAATASGQLELVVPRLVKIAPAQVDAAFIQLDLANCSRLLGDFELAAMFSDSGLRAAFVFRHNTPEAVRLPLIVGFAFDILELGQPDETAVALVRLGLQGGPLIQTGRDGHSPLKLLGSEDVGVYGTPESIMSQVVDMQMGGAFRTLERGSTEWWVAEIVASALAHRARPPRHRRRRDLATAQDAARQLLVAMPSIAAHAARRHAVEAAARAVTDGAQPR